MIAAFWYKAFWGPTNLLRDEVWELIESGEGCPAWFVEGRTVLIPKEGCEGKPEQYRPITCLNTSYKLLTGALTVLLMAHAEAMDLLPIEQKALRRGARGCMDALAIDNAVTEEARVWARNLSVAWIDFRKAYDMTPHRWIEDMLEAIEAPEIVQRALTKLIPLWKTRIELLGETRMIVSPVTFRRVLYQGDSLSPLLFCLCVAPLSSALRKGGGFNSQFQREPVTHLMFMVSWKTITI